MWLSPFLKVSDCSSTICPSCHWEDAVWIGWHIQFVSFTCWRPSLVGRSAPSHCVGPSHCTLSHLPAQLNGYPAGISYQSSSTLWYRSQCVMLLQHPPWSPSSLRWLMASHCSNAWPWSTEAPCHRCPTPYLQQLSWLHLLFPFSCIGVQHVCCSCSDCTIPFGCTCFWCILFVHTCVVFVACFSAWLLCFELVFITLSVEPIALIFSDSP